MRFVTLVMIALATTTIAPIATANTCETRPVDAECSDPETSRHCHVWVRIADEQFFEDCVISSD